MKINVLHYCPSIVIFHIFISFHICSFYTHMKDVLCFILALILSLSHFVVVTLLFTGLLQVQVIVQLLRYLRREQINKNRKQHCYFIEIRSKFIQKMGYITKRLHYVVTKGSKLKKKIGYITKRSIIS